MLRHKVANVDYQLCDRCDILYDPATGVGLAVIQQRWNGRLKHTWWGNVDRGVMTDILDNPLLNDVFYEKAEKADKNGQFPFIEVRKLMWALKMRPMPKQFWETRF